MLGHFQSCYLEKSQWMILQKQNSSDSVLQLNMYSTTANIVFFAMVLGASRMR